MPWKVYSENGKQHCVHKLNADGSKGDLVHCHDSDESARSQVRALYASEAKELFLDQAVNQIKGVLESDRPDVREVIQAILDEYLVRKSASPTEVTDDVVIPESDGETDGGEAQEKESNDMHIVDKLKSMLDTVVSAVKPVFERKDTSNDIMLWKEGDTYRWIGRYSNNFRDNDNPPEIISAESHKRFVKMVDDGLVRLPELWIWHMKNMPIGIADWVAYDDSAVGGGFALAGGHSLPGTNEIFETLANVKGIAMSHGMPEYTIKRDQKDSSIIVEHETVEISILPRWSAANKLTGFAVISNSEEETMIPSEKKERLAKEWGLSPAQIDALEAMNASDAEKAVSAGIERKENEETTMQPAETASANAETVSPVVEPSAPATPTLEEVQDALRASITEALQPYVDKLNKLEADLKEIKTAEDARVVKAAAGTPLASLAALLGQTVQSAVGNPETAVDGRTSLAKSKPVETNPTANGKTLVPFINDMLAPKQQ